MISDLFRARRRPLAMAIFGTSSAIAGIAFFPIIGWIGQHHGWRSMFLVSGIPGVLLALIFLLTVREPARGGRDEAAAPARPAGIAETARFLAGSRAYLLLVAGATFMGANLFAAAAWAPTFLARVHGMSLSEIAVALGTVRGALATLGILAAGVLIDRLGRDRPKTRARIPAIACFIAGPAEALFLLGEPGWLWMTGFAFSSLFVLAYQGPAFALGMSVVRAPMRAVATSIMVFSAALLGQVFGPLIVGMLNDALASELGAKAVRYSMLVGAITPVFAGVMFWLAGNRIEADAARASTPA
jgi:predicted MFS family arabinose efflux permease